jgi:6,7-dimethyl-8-ribityllumazine synthase
MPIIFCVLTCDTTEQAMERSGPGDSNKGREAGLAAVEMASLARKLKSSTATSAKRAAKPIAKPRKARR